ncbi:hypothetical protein RRG08_002641 [Elysia crispata]|uniref:Uncharacterized protein n=1 Tax=Elysia crispata TaxID=231223 RepID=A0AAE1CSS2_9GAST|nr:hypothetical protein RRG08_002641 [Elysia crispata]
MDISLLSVHVPRLGLPSKCSGDFCGLHASGGSTIVRRGQRMGLMVRSNTQFYSNWTVGADGTAWTVRHAIYTLGRTAELFDISCTSKLGMSYLRVKIRASRPLIFQLG